MEAVPDPSVQVENPAVDTISISTDLTGTVEPGPDVVYVAAMGSGEVLEVYVNQGEMVEKDQTLFKIDNKQLEVCQDPVKYGKGILRRCPDQFKPDEGPL